MQKRQKLIDRLVFCLVNFRKGIGHNSTPSIDSLPRAQGEAFFVIGHEKSVTLGDLARHLSVTPGAATQLVEPLVQSGYVIRTPDTKDRRTIHLTLTETGSTYQKTLKTEKMSRVTGLLEVLSDDELSTLTELLEKVNTAVNTKK